MVVRVLTTNSEAKKIEVIYLNYSMTDLCTHEIRFPRKK
jgi:hypothetical protein